MAFISRIRIALLHPRQSSRHHALARLMALQVSTCTLINTQRWYAQSCAMQKRRSTPPHRRHNIEIDVRSSAAGSSSHSFRFKCIYKIFHVRIRSRKHTHRHTRAQLANTYSRGHAAHGGALMRLETILDSPARDRFPNSILARSARNSLRVNGVQARARTRAVCVVVSMLCACTRYGQSCANVYLPGVAKLSNRTIIIIYII